MAALPAIVLTAVLTAVLSSVLTVALASLVLDRWGDRFLEARIEAAGQEIERRVRSAALQAGEELLPGIRARVREGFEEAVQSFASGRTFFDAMLGRKRKE